MRHLLPALLVLFIGADAALAADQPVAGRKLLLKRTVSREKLVLVLNDPAVPVPAPGSADDPAASAGLRLDVVGAASLATATFEAPGGVGSPGWSVKPGAPTRYRYTNSAAPAGPSRVRLVTLREGRGIKLIARQVGLPMTAPEGGIAVRITMGGTRVCAVFTGAAVRKDTAGIFLAQDAAAPGTTSCADDALIPCDAASGCHGLCAGDGECGGVPELGCACVSPSQPCGDTAPLCNGECPAGEECASIGGVPYPSCGCLPTGSTPCGSVYPACGDGDCPPGRTCLTDTFTCCGGVTITNCACLSGPSPPPCGGTCPQGWTCVQIPGQPAFCIPPFCTGGDGAPTCNGSCNTPGDRCHTFQSSCFCLPGCAGGDPGTTCGGTCAQSGLSCQPNPATGLCACAP